MNSYQELRDETCCVCLEDFEEQIYRKCKCTGLICKPCSLQLLRCAVCRRTYNKFTPDRYQGQTTTSPPIPWDLVREQIAEINHRRRRELQDRRRNLLLNTHYQSQNSQRMPTDNIGTPYASQNSGRIPISTNLARIITRTPVLTADQILDYFNKPINSTQ